MKTLLKYSLFVMALLIGTLAMAQTVKIQTQHKVKKSETIYGIAKQYGITQDQLIAANPEMKMPGYELKKGDYINIPEGQAAPATQAPQGTQNAPVVQPVQTSKSKLVKVGVMLPLHNNDGDGQRMVEYYRGLLLAFDRVAKDSIKVDVHAWNVPKGADIQNTLKEKGAAECDLIIGPLYTEMVKPLAEFCKANGIKLVIPFSIDGEPAKKYENVFQVYQSNEEMDNMAIEKFSERFVSYHPVIIDAQDPASTKGKFTSQLRKMLEKKGIKYSLTSLSTSENDFARAFDLSKPNIVILNTERSPKLNEAFAKLNILTAANKNINVSMLGYTEWLMYIQPYQDLYFKYDVHIPTYFFYNATSRDTKWVEQSYTKKFNLDMDVNGLPRFALTGFDHGCFFIGGMAQYGAAFTGAKGQIAYKSVQTPLHFKKEGKGYKNANFMFVHYRTDRTIEAISY
ncbi:MAG: LysM peptidoglycan-binding domain-containing protein [Prevotella sp.]|nr:LysM peptidoglycan-binding domain-containing protein [Prevotella sp.]